MLGDRRDKQRWSRKITDLFIFVNTFIQKVWKRHFFLVIELPFPGSSSTDRYLECCLLRLFCFHLASRLPFSKFLISRIQHFCLGRPHNDRQFSFPTSGQRPATFSHDSDALELQGSTFIRSVVPDIESFPQYSVTTSLR